jgi:predicted alpha/beta superfamily hydrolase
LGLIVGLQDPDKISHAGSISVSNHSRNRSIGRGLASLPEPHQEIGDVSHGVLAAPTTTVSIS